MPGVVEANPCVRLASGQAQGPAPTICKWDLIFWKAPYRSPAIALLGLYQGKGNGGPVGLRDR
jgi:hypothetical protein